MGKRTGILFLSITLASGAFYSPANNNAAAAETVTIAADQVNVREGPSLSYPLITQLKKGEKYSIVKEKNDWTQLKLADGQTGWVANWLVSKAARSTSDNSQVSKPNAAVSSTGNLRVRSGPGTTFQIIGYLNKGQSVSVLEKNENWVKISDSFGEGWVASAYLNMKNDQTSQSNLSSTGTINSNNVNVRSDASASSKILGKLSKGKTIDVLSQKGDWLEFRLAGQQAWISSQFVDLVDKKEQKNSEPLSGMIGTVTANGLHVRDNASLNANIVGTVNKGQSFSILAEVNNWAKIEYASGKNGWISNLYLDKSASKSSSAGGQAVKESTATILQNGTNLRKAPSLQADVIKRANEGDQFTITKVEKDWYEVMLKDGEKAYVAGWIVSVSGLAPRIERQGAEGYLKNKTIVLDPGHGGEDTGTTGAGGSLEKDLTLRTASLVYDKLKAAGANVILSRTRDEYVSLPSRVSTARFQQADAFVSLHYDSNLDRSVRGETGYYYYSYQKSLAKNVLSAVNAETGLKNRGVRFGDFHVIRENPQKATLIELGYLSNPEEEMTLNSKQFQENAATGIYNGLARYFKNK
ncbi:SH3 domain-containing protein [Bacillota bacterium Lsc_1132]